MREVHRREGLCRAQADARGGAGRGAAVLRRDVRPSDARADSPPRPTMCRGSIRRPARSTASSSSSPTSPSSASTELALRESEARFRRIANSAPAMMWVTRLDRVRDFVNDAYVEFARARTDREDARTLDWRERIHPDDVDRIVAESIAGEASRSASRSRAATCATTANGAGCAACRSRGSGRTGSWSGSSGSRPTSPWPRRPSSSCAARSTSRRRSWRRQRAQFRAVFEAALEVMVLLEPDGTVIGAQQPARSLASRQPREAIGQKLWDAPTMQAYPQQIPVMKKGIAAAAKGKIFTTEVKLERDGRSDRLPRRLGAAGARARRARSSICCSKRATSPSSRPRRSSCARARRWRRWASSPAASRTTSTIC